MRTADDAGPRQPAHPAGHNSCPVTTHTRSFQSAAAVYLISTRFQEPLVQYTSILDQASASSATSPLGHIPASIRAGEGLPCQDPQTADLWFGEHTAQAEQAKSLCQSCPIKRECLTGAMHRGEPWGVWGGEVFVDGAVVPRRRGRGRPRKGDPYAPSNRTSAA